MDDEKFIEECFLRPICDARATNMHNAPPSTKVAMKTEMQVLRLSTESQKITMETLRAIHGNDFRLNDSTNYEDKGRRMKKLYWEDQGTLIVQSVTDFSARRQNPDSHEDKLRRYALLKLENYGFAPTHCVEAYDNCNSNTDEALLLLFRKYMRVPDISDPNGLATIVSSDELINMRLDEKSALESIYDKAFEEKERDSVWSLKFAITHLLVHSPSEMHKATETVVAYTADVKNKRPVSCRNFERTGTCRFGSRCRFTHMQSQVAKEQKKTKSNTDKENKWFYLEVRFPPNTKYPFEAPYVFLKTTCHDIPRDVLLKISRRLYQEASEICRDGMPCVYSISELLQMDETITEYVGSDHKQFPSAEKSLFYVGTDDDDQENDAFLTKLASHYERGQTSYGNGMRRTTEQLAREDKLIMTRFLERQSDERYRRMIASRQKLPAFGVMMEILDLLEKSHVIVVSGETGCGKSTQVPQFILDNWLFQSSKLNKSTKMPHCEIICTQPRRLSAINVAERVAEERVEQVGQVVGYQIRLENKISANTRLNFCTTGILLRRLVSDPLLESVTHIIVDEVHERSVESDFLLMILKDILQRRSDLRVILMSATLNAKLFSEYFGNIPVLDIPGRTYHVEQLFLEDILQVCDYAIECDSPFCRKIEKKDEEEFLRKLERFSDIQSERMATPHKIKDENLNLEATCARYVDCSKKTCKTIYLMDTMKVNPELIESVLKYIVQGEHEWPRNGSILIFLPGLQEIQNVLESLSDSPIFGVKANNFLLLPLHSTLSSEEQSLVFRQAPRGKQKIVLSTNIAETSVTIDDCVFVIDYGLMKEKRFDANRNMESLDLVWVSRANAMQRKGRAGRVMPGVCIHLYTSNRYHYNMISQPIPEIHRVPLEQLLLRLKTLPNFAGKNAVEVLGCIIEPPTEENIISAVHRLQDVGALDDDQTLTPLGHHLSALPVDVRIGKLMLFGAIFQCLDSVLTIAACLSHKTPFVSPFNKRAEAEICKRKFAICNSDHLTCLMAYKKWLEISKRNLIASRNYADEHFLSLRTLHTISDIKYQLLELLVSIGFVPVNIPRRRNKSHDKIYELTGSDLNLNGDNNRLLLSLLCAALYPNVVKILTPERSYVQTAGGAMPKLTAVKDLRFKTRDDGFVAIHPSSVNSDVANFLTPFLVYQEKVKTSRIFIKECSTLPLVPLALFAGSDLRVELHDGDFFFLLEEGWIVLKAYDHETAEMIQCLRVELVKLLEEKIRDPCLNLLNHECGQKIIENIVYLITNNN